MDTMPGRPPEEAALAVLRLELAVATRHERLSYALGAFLWIWDDRKPMLDGVLWRVSQSAAGWWPGDVKSRRGAAARETTGRPAVGGGSDGAG